jgi:4'-phosphopantetheinyl transferase
LWLADQDQPPKVIESLRRTLSVDEIERASRFRFERDRLHFTVARGILRRMLGTLLEIDASRVRFRYSGYGKPSLSGEFDSSRLKFNISHSGGRLLMAFAIGRDIGVDIEHIRPDFASYDIAERFFSASEVQRLRSLPSALLTEAFFNCWTRKEAYIKAIGEGLSCPLDKFDVSLAPGEPARLLATRVQGLSADRWVMRTLDVGEFYKAAMVVERASGKGNDGKIEDTSSNTASRGQLKNDLQVPWVRFGVD